MKEAFEKIKERFVKVGNIQFSSHTKPLITVEDAIEIVNQVAEEYKDNGYEIFTEEQLKAIEDMNIKNFNRMWKQQDDRWIPVSERLPEESLNSVIGWDEYRDRCCFVQYLGGRWVLGNDIDSVKIVAWRPLPAPYQPKEE